jgi:hypothetical protein
MLSQKSWDFIPLPWMGLVEMFTNALASIVSSLAEKFDDFPMELPLAFVDGDLCVFLRIFFFATVGSFDFVLVSAFGSAFSRGAFFFCPAEEGRSGIFGWPVSDKVDASGISIVVAAAAANLRWYW